MNNDETSQHLRSYETGINELEQLAQLDEEMPEFIELFNTQPNNDENEDENKFISNLMTQDDEESKLKGELLPDDTYTENDEPLPQVKKRSISSTKNPRVFKFSRVSREKSSASNNSELFKSNTMTSSKEENDGKFNDDLPKTETNKHSYHNLMVNDFKLNHLIDDDSD